MKISYIDLELTLPEKEVCRIANNYGLKATIQKARDTSKINSFDLFRISGKPDRMQSLLISLLEDECALGLISNEEKKRIRKEFYIPPYMMD